MTRCITVPFCHKTKTLILFLYNKCALEECTLEKVIKILFILDLDEINEKFDFLVKDGVIAKFLKDSKVATNTSAKNEIKKQIRFASSVSKNALLPVEDRPFM